MSLPLPVSDGLSLLAGLRSHAEVVAQLAAWFLEGDLLESADADDFANFRRECARVLPRAEAELVGETTLLEVVQEAVRQLREGRERDLALVRNAELWLRAAVAGSDELVARDPEEALDERRERVRVLAGRGDQAEALDARADEHYDALMREPPGGRSLFPRWWPGDRGRDRHRQHP